MSSDQPNAKTEARQARALRGLNRNVAMQRAEALREPVSRGGYGMSERPAEQVERELRILAVHLRSGNGANLIAAAQNIAAGFENWESLP